uniref:Uncharacterized protein n=1 Tax=Chrysemys picta bellii TaxID=8478 RepID=A0A8C3FXP6_CHRPI
MSRRALRRLRGEQRGQEPLEPGGLYKGMQVKYWVLGGLTVMFCCWGFLFLVLMENRLTVVCWGGSS